MSSPLPSPHGYKLKALLSNPKLPINDQVRVQEAILHYETWRKGIETLQQSVENPVPQMVALLNEYRTYVDINLIFDSPNDFLYRQKGQLKLDNSVIEEFIPMLITTVLFRKHGDHELFFGPTTCFSGLRFESTITDNYTGGGLKIRTKDQDFAISKKLFIQASHLANFQDSITEQIFLAYLVAECKTNLDKTMFQEAAATALDLKTVVPAAKYYLLCEWLDMTPISTSTTAIDEILILRKFKRLSSHIRAQFNTVEGRRRNKAFFADYLNAHPISIDPINRFVAHVHKLFQDESEDNVISRGYF